MASLPLIAKVDYLSFGVSPAPSGHGSVESIGSGVDISGVRTLGLFAKVAKTPFISCPGAIDKPLM